MSAKIFLVVYATEAADHSGESAHSTLHMRSVSTMSPMTAELLRLPWQALAELIRQDTGVTEALHGRFPGNSAHLGFDELTPAWVRKYAPQILRAIGRLKDIQQWTWSEATVAGIAIDRIAADLLTYLGLPQTKTLICTALVIILIKGLQSSTSDSPQPRQ